jgi:hypothetical protein
MSIIISNAEKRHEQLYRLHWAAKEAADLLHFEIVALTSASRYEANRKQLRPIIEKLEAARESADSALMLAGEARTLLIRLTGCNGKCSDRALGESDEEPTGDDQHAP